MAQFIMQKPLRGGMSLLPYAYALLVCLSWQCTLETPSDALPAASAGRLALLPFALLSSASPMIATDIGFIMNKPLLLEDVDVGMMLRQLAQRVTALETALSGVQNANTATQTNFTQNVQEEFNKQVQTVAGVQSNVTMLQVEVAELISSANALAVEVAGLFSTANSLTMRVMNAEAVVPESSPLVDTVRALQRANQTISNSVATRCNDFTLALAGGGGSASATPINSVGCSTGKYLGGTVITVIATPFNGYLFGQWSGDRSSTSSIFSFTMPTSASALSASFLPCLQLMLTFSVGGSSVTASPSSSPGCAPGYFIAGAALMLNANTASGFVFTGWTGTLSIPTSSYSYIMPTTAASQTATFAQCFPLTLVISPAGHGIVSKFPMYTYGCGADQYTAGTSVSLIASPIAAFRLRSWSGVANSTSPNVTFIVPAAAAVLTAMFVPVGPPTLAAIQVWGQPDFVSAISYSAGPTSMNSPVGVTVDSVGNVYVADHSFNRVLMFAPGATSASQVYGQLGSYITTGVNTGGVSADSLNAPWSVAIDADDNLYISDWSNHRVLKYAPGSTTATQVWGQGGSFTTQSPGTTASTLQNPWGMTLDAVGNLYVADEYNNRVLLFSCGSTTATRVYGQHGDFTLGIENNGGISASSLYRPAAVAVDSYGNVYVTDYGNSRVLYYPATTTVATRVYGQASFSSVSAGSGSASVFNYPSGLVLDYEDNLFLSDTNNSRVLMFPASSTAVGAPASKVWGQQSSFSTSAVNVGALGLNLPGSISFDKAGSMYLTDLGNHRVLRFPPT